MCAVISDAVGVCQLPVKKPLELKIGLCYIFRTSSGHSNAKCAAMALCWIRCGISPFWRSIRPVQCGVRIWCHAWWPVLVLLPASNEILPRSLSHMCAPSLSVKSFQDQKSYMKFRSICESFGHFKARARGICSALMEQHLQGPMVDGGAFHRPMWGQKIVIWMACYQLQLRGAAGSLQEPSARLCHGWQARLESMAKQHRGNLCQRDILQCARSLSQVPAVSGAWNQGLWVEFRGRKPKAKSAGATLHLDDTIGRDDSST